MLIMAVRASLLCKRWLPAARRLRERVWQYYIVRALFAAFVDYNIERMGGMGREMHTCYRTLEARFASIVAPSEVSVT